MYKRPLSHKPSHFSWVKGGQMQLKWLYDNSILYISPRLVSRMSFLGLLNWTAPGAFIRINE